MGTEQFLQVNLVGAFQNGVGIVNDCQAKGLCFLGKPEGVVIYIRSLADKQCVVLNEFVYVILCDKLGIESRLDGSFIKTLERTVVGRRMRIIRVGKDRQVVFFFVGPVVTLDRKSVV